LAKKAFKATAAVTTLGGSVAAEKVAKKLRGKDDEVNPPTPEEVPTDSEAPEEARSAVAPKKFKGDTYKLPADYDIEFDLNLSRLAESEAEALLGKKRKNAEVEERRVQVLVSRDTASKFKNSVKVELSDGRFVGWVSKDDSDNACTIIDGVAKLRKRRDRDKGIRLQVTLEVEGEWEDGDPYIHDARLLIKEPVNAKLID